MAKIQDNPILQINFPATGENKPITGEYSRFAAVTTPKQLRSNFIAYNGPGTLFTCVPANLLLFTFNK